MLEKYADQILGAILTGGGAVLTAVLAWSYQRANESPKFISNFLCFQQRMFRKRMLAVQLQ